MSRASGTTVRLRGDTRENLLGAGALRGFCRWATGEQRLAAFAFEMLVAGMAVMATSVSGGDSWCPPGRASEARDHSCGFTDLRTVLRGDAQTNGHLVLPALDLERHAADVVEASRMVGRLVVASDYRVVTSRATCSPSTEMSMSSMRVPKHRDVEAESYSASAGKVCVITTPPRAPYGVPST